MASRGNVQHPLTFEHIFNYENAKLAFKQELGYVLLEKKLQTRVVHHKKDIDEIISDIKLNRTHNKEYFSEKCQVVNENGKDILCQVITGPTDNKSLNVVEMKQIICLDELFDILSELHMVKPQLDEAGILDHFSNSLIHKVFVTLFWKSCESCNSIVKNVDKHSRTVGEITVFSLDSPDGKFTDILMYIERNTNFILLRPLKSLSNNEIAYELLTIFADFGPPTFLDSDILRCHIKYNNILNILKLLEPPFRVPSMYANSRNHKIKVATKKAKEMLQNWMKETESSNWAIGIVVIQWLMNTNLVLDTYIRSRLVTGPINSPYHGLFGMSPNTDIIKIKEKRKPEPTKSEEKVLVDCSQCYLPIYKAFKCHFCQRLFHFSCCARFVKQTRERPIFINKCGSCAVTCADEKIILGT